MQVEDKVVCFHLLEYSNLSCLKITVALNVLLHVLCTDTTPTPDETEAAPTRLTGHKELERF